MLPPQTLYFGGVLLGKALKSLWNVFSGPPSITYTFTAVPYADAAAWLSAHAAVPYTRFAEMLREQGYPRSEAQSCLDQGERMEARNRGCYVFCWNVQPG